MSDIWWKSHPFECEGDCNGYLWNRICYLLKDILVYYILNLDIFSLSDNTEGKQIIMRHADLFF